MIGVYQGPKKKKKEGGHFAPTSRGQKNLLCKGASKYTRNIFEGFSGQRENLLSLVSTGAFYRTQACLDGVA